MTDFCLRADAIPNTPATPAPDHSPLEPVVKRWHVVVALGLAVTLAVLLATALLLRQRRPTAVRAAQPPTGTEVVRFSCSGCGKHLKATATVAGKLIKCPHCGTAVQVPESPPGGQ